MSFEINGFDMDLTEAACLSNCCSQGPAFCSWQTSWLALLLSHQSASQLVPAWRRSPAEKCMADKRGFIDCMVMTGLTMLVKMENP